MSTHVYNIHIAHGTCSFETYVDQSADGATKVDGATSLDACLDACSDHSCYAVEYSEEYGCYRHTTAYVESTMKDNAGVTIYKYKTCTGTMRFITSESALNEMCFTADCPVWDKKENMQGVGGISFADASTSAECKAACIADDNCAGYDLDVSSTPYTCWLHMSPDNFDPPKAKTGVNLYILVSRCPGVCSVDCFPAQSLNATRTIKLLFTLS